MILKNRKVVVLMIKLKIAVKKNSTATTVAVVRGEEVIRVQDQAVVVIEKKEIEGEEIARVEVVVRVEAKTEEVKARKESEGAEVVGGAEVETRVKRRGVELGVEGEEAEVRARAGAKVRVREAKVRREGKKTLRKKKKRKQLKEGKLEKQKQGK